MQQFQVALADILDQHFESVFSPDILAVRGHILEYPVLEEGGDEGYRQHLDPLCGNDPGGQYRIEAAGKKGQCPRHAAASPLASNSSAQASVWPDTDSPASIRASSRTRWGRVSGSTLDRVRPSTTSLTTWKWR